MMKKIVLAASAAAVVLGAGTAALATSGGSSASPAASSPAPGSSAPGSSAPGSSAQPSDPGKSAAPGQSTPSGQHKAPGQLRAPGQLGAPGMPGLAGRGKGLRPALRALGRALHAQWVTPDRDNAGGFVTHNAIRGAVTAVSASSITVKAEDGVSQTYAVTDATKVRLRKGQPGKGNRAGAAGTISDVHVGDKVAVVGTGATSLTAQHIVDARE